MKKEKVENIKPVIHPQGLYKYEAGMNVGVLVTKKVMKKLAKLQADHADKVRRVLLDEADDGNVFPTMWTLYYPEGKQTTVQYIDTANYVDVKQSILHSLPSSQPIKMDLVFVASSMDEAKGMAQQHHEDIKELEK